MNNPKNSLPNGWSLKKLGEIGTFSKGAGITKDELVESGIPCIRYGELYTIHDFVIREYKSFINRELAKQSRRISKNDILMAGSGETLKDIGKAAAFVGDEEVYAGGDIIIFTPETYVNSVCLSYLLNSGIVAEQKSKLGQGNSVVHIYSKDLSKLEIPLPTLPEQQKIAAILGTWDTAIHTTTTLLATLQKRKKALMQQLLTPKPDWKEVRLGECFDFIKTESFSRENLTYDIEQGSFFYIHYGDIHAKFNKSILDLNSERRIPRLKNECSQKAFQFLKSGDLVFADASEDLVGIGDCVELKNVEPQKVIGGLHTIAIRPKTTFAPDFLGYLFMSKSIKKQMQSTATGISVYGLSKTNLANFQFSYPPLAEQIRIAEILNAADAELRQTKVYLEKLKQQKQGLMQQLLTGKVRVITT